MQNDKPPQRGCQITGDKKHLMSLCEFVRIIHATFGPVPLAALTAWQYLSLFHHILSVISLCKFDLV